MSSLCEECDVIRSVEEYVPKELQMAEQNKSVALSACSAAHLEVYRLKYL